MRHSKGRTCPMLRPRSLTAALLLCAALPLGAAGAEQKLEARHPAEPSIVGFPTQRLQMELPGGQTLIDYAVSPKGPRVAVLVRERAGGQVLHFWDVTKNVIASSHPLRTEATLNSVLWHPVADDLYFAAAFSNGKHGILRADAAHQWKPWLIHQAALPPERMVFAPRPFGVGYRLFFGQNYGNHRGVETITENGRMRYKVIGTGDQPARVYQSSNDGSAEAEARWAQELPGPIAPPGRGVLPVAFHPAGHLFYLQDTGGCYLTLRYTRSWEDNFAPAFADQKLCGGELWFLANGMGFLRWSKGQAGVTLHTRDGRVTRTLLPQQRFLSLPIATIDGRGLVAYARDHGKETLYYEPVALPLGDIANAWMFATNDDEEQRIATDGGLFRATTDDQLFYTYDKEFYECGGYLQAIPSRPHLVTTDIFWEVFAAAFEGSFILVERELALPAFWELVQRAHAQLQGNPRDPWARVFDVMQAVRSGKLREAALAPELAQVLASGGASPSLILPTKEPPFDFGNLAPRSHYTAPPRCSNTSAPSAISPRLPTASTRPRWRNFRVRPRPPRCAGSRATAPSSPPRAAPWHGRMPASSRPHSPTRCARPRWCFRCRGPSITRPSSTPPTSPVFRRLTASRAAGCRPGSTSRPCSATATPSSCWRNTGSSSATPICNGVSARCVSSGNGWIRPRPPCTNAG